MAMLSAFLPTPRSPRLSLTRSLQVMPLLIGSVAAAADTVPAELFMPRDLVVAWREDPRPAADTPAGVEVPPSRRGTRRAQRRSTRRRQPVDDPPIESVPAVPPPRMSPPRAVDAYQKPGSPSSSVSAAEIFSAASSPLSATIDFPPVQPDAPPAAPGRAADAIAGGIATHRDQPYGQHADGQPRNSRQRFDLYLPSGCNAGGMPLVVWIHGDSWRDGSKADCPLTWLASEGYAVASIGYRLSDTAVFPAQLDDCRAAIMEIERNFTVWGIDPQRVAVVGSGGGGHLAALVGLTSQPTPVRADRATGADDTTAADQATLPQIAAVCAVAAPVSLTTLGPEHDRAGSAASRLVGGPLPEFREAAQRASPVTHISADDPPVLLVHGAADTDVPVRQAEEFAAALKAAGVDSTLVILPDVGHRPGLDLKAPGGQAILTFLDRVLGPGIRPDRGRDP